MSDTTEGTESQTRDRNLSGEDVDFDERFRTTPLTLTQLTTYRNVLTPISKLDDDTLSLVFILLAKDARRAFATSGSDSGQPPNLYSWVRITHVCRYWRQLSLNLPLLWAWIVPGYSGISTAKYIARSGGACGLTIEDERWLRLLGPFEDPVFELEERKIKHSEPVGPRDENDSRTALTDLIVQMGVVSDNLSRVENLVVHADLPRNVHPTSSLPKELPHLRSLTILRDEWDEDSWLDLLAGCSMPNLKFLCCRASLPFEPHCSWLCPSLTSLWIVAPDEQRHITSLGFLKPLQALETLRIDYVDRIDLASKDGMAQISLPKVRFLYISDSRNDGVAAISLLNHLNYSASTCVKALGRGQYGLKAARVLKALMSRTILLSLPTDELAVGFCGLDHAFGKDVSIWRAHSPGGTETDGDWDLYLRGRPDLSFSYEQLEIFLVEPYEVELTLIRSFSPEIASRVTSLIIMKPFCFHLNRHWHVFESFSGVERLRLTWWDPIVLGLCSPKEGLDVLFPRLELLVLNGAPYHLDARHDPLRPHPTEMEIGLAQRISQRRTHPVKVIIDGDSIFLMPEEVDVLKLHINVVKEMRLSRMEPRLKDSDIDVQYILRKYLWHRVAGWRWL